MMSVWIIPGSYAPDGFVVLVMRANRKSNVACHCLDYSAPPRKWIRLFFLDAQVLTQAQLIELSEFSFAGSSWLRPRRGGQWLDARCRQ